MRAEIDRTLERIPVDFGGGCSTSKAQVLGWLIRRFGLATTLDIGVYRGRSLFPQALAHRYTGGVVYGVDPWSIEEMREDELPDEIRDDGEHFFAKVDLPAIYEQVKTLRDELQLGERIVLVRDTSADAAGKLPEQFDMIHIDGNHDTHKVRQDLETYLPRLRPKGFLVIDDVSWPSVQMALESLSAPKVLERVSNDRSDDYAIYRPGASRRGALAVRARLLAVR